MEKHSDGFLESQVNMLVLEEKELWNTSSALSVLTRGLGLLKCNEKENVFEISLRVYPDGGGLSVKP